MNWTDDYELRARIIPSAIIIFPIVIPVYLIIQDQASSFVSFLFSGAIIIALLYAISFSVREKGANIQEQLWKRWDGPPSTRFLRWRDSTIDEDMKKQIHEAVRLYCELNLYSRDEEQMNPEEADKKINQAFLHVKPFVYHADPNGKWTKYNAEYGFNRNLLGCKMYWICSATIGVVICGVGWYFSEKINFVLGVVLDSLLFLWAVAWGGYVLPRTVQVPADLYAKSVWQSFLVIIKKKTKNL